MDIFQKGAHNGFLLSTPLLSAGIRHPKMKEKMQEQSVRASVHTLHVGKGGRRDGGRGT